MRFFKRDNSWMLGWATNEGCVFGETRFKTLEEAEKFADEMKAAAIDAKPLDPMAVALLADAAIAVLFDRDGSPRPYVKVDESVDVGELSRQVEYFRKRLDRLKEERRNEKRG